MAATLVLDLSRQQPKQQMARFMRGNYVSVSEISLLPLLQFNQDQLRSFFFTTHNDKVERVPISGSTAPTDTAAKPTALIVDDVVDVTEMLSVFLSLAGYRVVTARSASAAIEAARSQQFDVVISDIGMPHMNGYELAQTLRAIPGYETVPMVAVTGFSMYDDRERSLRSGFNAHLTKPIDPNVLFQIIERLRG
jgi:CheY-like chemotaxis protein